MFSQQIGRNMEVYVDDMLVKSKEELTHLDDLKETFATLKKHQMRLNQSKCVFGVASGKFLGFMVSQRGIEANPEKVQAIINMASPKTVKEVQKLTGRIAVLNRFISKATDKCLPLFQDLEVGFHLDRRMQSNVSGSKALPEQSTPLKLVQRRGRPIFILGSVNLSSKCNPD